MIKDLTMSESPRGEKERLHTPISQEENEVDVLNLNRDHEPGLINGLTAFTAALFIVGEMAGSGVLALPEAVANTGWVGVVLIIVLGILSGTCGIVLSRSWLILRRDFREYQEHVRYPYPALGFHTYGKTGKYVVQFCINATLIGEC
jgi:vesicular inhibitory amino acid transporter